MLDHGRGLPAARDVRARSRAAGSRESARPAAATAEDGDASAIAWTGCGSSSPTTTASTPPESSPSHRVGGRRPRRGGGRAHRATAADRAPRIGKLFGDRAPPRSCRSRVARAPRRLGARASTRRPAPRCSAAVLGGFGDPPDLVASGINPGANTGHLVIHSGTVGAALTARRARHPGDRGEPPVEHRDGVLLGHRRARSRWRRSSGWRRPRAAPAAAQPQRPEPAHARDQGRARGRARAAR